ncbi:MAG: hypothetical protein AB8G23_02165 [Myxococcota bacterium]
MQKQSVWVLWIGAILAMLLASGMVATIGRWTFWLLIVVHFAEFVLKRDVFKQVGGSMGNHFVQTMIYGLFHWRPLEEQLGEGSGTGD